MGLKEDVDRTGPVSFDEAREILRRFNASHFWPKDTGSERARYSIPADPMRDDDIRLDSFISQMEDTIARLTRERDEARAEVERLKLLSLDGRMLSLETAKLDERARVVAWLNKTHDAMGHTPPCEWECGSCDGAAAYGHAADAIEAGEHDRE